MQVDDDDVWGDEGDGSQAIAAQEWNKMSQQYTDAGYREGITAGKNSTLQQGFDEGFAFAAVYAQQVGQLRGIVAALLSLLTTSSGSKHGGNILSRLDASGNRDAAVASCRELVSDLGKLGEADVVPPDLEAEEHTRSHGNEPVSEVLEDKRDMASLEDGLNGMMGSKVARPTLAACRTRLQEVLALCGLDLGALSGS